MDPQSNLVRDLMLRLFNDEEHVGDKFKEGWNAAMREAIRVVLSHGLNLPAGDFLDEEPTLGGES